MRQKVLAGLAGICLTAGCSTDHNSNSPNSIISDSSKTSYPERTDPVVYFWDEEAASQEGFIYQHFNNGAENSLRLTMLSIDGHSSSPRTDQMLNYQGRKVIFSRRDSYRFSGQINSLIIVPGYLAGETFLDEKGRKLSPIQPITSEAEREAITSSLTNQN